jgi:hypothetical protein
MMVAEPPESFAKIHSATKIRTPFFYPSTVRYSREGSRQLEKPYSTLNLSSIMRGGTIAESRKLTLF